MSLLQEYKQTELAFEELKAKLAKLKEDDQIKRAAEFEVKLNALMQEYGVTDKELQIIKGFVKTGEKPPRKEIHRTMRRWTHPETGETYEGKNPAGKAKLWIAEFGVENVKVEELE